MRSDAEAGLVRPERLARPRMDPRIRQRRIDLARVAGRRRLRFLVAVLALVGIAGGCLAALHSPLLKVRRVLVAGTTGVERAEVLTAAGLGPGSPPTPMVDVNASGVASAVERLAWVSAAAVGRSWPGTVVIELTRRHPVAQMPDSEGGWAEIDATGHVIQVGAQPWKALPSLEGFGLAGAAGSLSGGTQAGLEVATVLAPTLEPVVAAVSTSAATGLGLTLSGGALVVLGAQSDLQSKLSTLETLLQQVDLSGVSQINLEVPEAPTLTRG